MKTLVTVSLFTMLLMAGAALAGDRTDPPAVPSKGIEGPDIRHVQMDARHGVAWPYVR